MTRPTAAHLVALAAVPHEGHCPHAMCTGALWRDCSCSEAWRREHWGSEQWEHWWQVSAPTRGRA